MLFDLLIVNDWDELKNKPADSVLFARCCVLIEIDDNRRNNMLTSLNFMSLCDASDLNLIDR